MRLKRENFQGAWVAQLVEHQTLGFGSGHDLTAPEFEPHWSSALTARSLPGILSPSLSAPPLLTLSLEINKLKNNFKKEGELCTWF